MNAEIEKCLDLACEIEGLLHLMQNRPLESLPANVKTLLAGKSAELSRLLQFGVKNDVQEEVENFETVTEQPVEGKEEKLDEEKLAETVAYEQEEDSQPDAGATDGYATKLDEAQAEEDEADTESSEIDKARSKDAEEIKYKKAEGAKIMQKIRLNDKYRFARELFGGSVTAMEAIVDEISTFGSDEEISRYLSERQGIDTTYGIGKEFFRMLVVASK